MAKLSGKDSGQAPEIDTAAIPIHATGGSGGFPFQTSALFVDLYELLMAQVYFKKHCTGNACFEVTVRSLPRNWGFFVFAGLQEIEAYLRQLRFRDDELSYLKAIGAFGDEFLSFLRTMDINVALRSLPEGAVFFPGEPILEVKGPLIAAQIIESYLLNILGFSVIEASLAARITLAARGRPCIDFGLRRAQGPLAALRAARGAQIAGFAATSNVFAAKSLDFRPAGTMAHSFVQVHSSQRDAFLSFIDAYGEASVLVVDTYNPWEGIRDAAWAAKYALDHRGLHINGIRIDSGDFVGLSRYARRYFETKGIDYMKIYISGGLDEYGICDCIDRGANVDGFGIGSRFAVSHHAPDIDIVYKLIDYDGRPTAKTSDSKVAYPGRKSVLRTIGRESTYERDTVTHFPAPGDLLEPFTHGEAFEAVRRRLDSELRHLEASVKRITSPEEYPVVLHLENGRRGETDHASDHQ